MFRNITNEAALEARDRIPLPQFNGLHESYNALHTKLATQIPPAATTHQFVGTGAATEATSVVDLVSAARKISEETDKAPTSLGMPTNRQEEKAEDVDDEESGEDTNEEEENEIDESEDGESDQEVMGEGDDVSGDNSSEEGSSDDASGSEEGSETDSDTGSEEVGGQEVVGEESIFNIQRDQTGFSFKADLEIQHQASVNKLEGMTPFELTDCLSSSLKIFLREQQLSSRSVHISSVKLLDSGNITYVMRAKTRGTLQHIIDSGGCFRRFERSLIGSSVSTYNVAMHQVDERRLNFQTRKEKSAIIRKLTDANRAVGEVNGVKPMIGDIRWSQYPGGGRSSSNSWTRSRLLKLLCVVSIGRPGDTAVIGQTTRTLVAYSSDAPGVKIMAIINTSASPPFDAENAQSRIQQRPAQTKQ